MDKEKVFKYFFIILLILVIYLTFLIIKPFFSYIILALIITSIFNPVYLWLNKRVKNKHICSAVMVILVLLILLIPLFLVSLKIAKEATTAFSNFSKPETFDTISVFIRKVTGVENFDLNLVIQKELNTFKESLSKYIVSIISSVANTGLGLFIMFSIMYYLFINGTEFYTAVREFIPLHERYKNRFFEEIKNILQAAVYGQTATSLVQGVLGGLLFLICRVPNPLLWGFVMFVFAFLPVLGTPLVFAPAGILELAKGNTFGGICVLIFGFVVVMNIDNVLKPKIISKKAGIHPLVALLGVFGGVVVFGFIGIVIGPTVLVVLLTFLKEYVSDFNAVKNIENSK